MTEASKPLLKVSGLKKYFPIHQGLTGRAVKNVQAVDDVSFFINRGETFGLVGESGCGKSTAGRTIIRLYDVTDGTVEYDGVDIAHMSQRELMPFRKKMQMIFQDPYASLNARMTVSDIICEPIEVHGTAQGKKPDEVVKELLHRVGLKQEHASRYPHEFSGGQRQRIGIARALAVNPELIICDEPISALDVSIQAQVVNMLEDFQREENLTYLFIAHDLSMVRHISSRIGVMYLGKLVEVAGSDELYDHPLHPYTQALLSAVPVPDPDHSMRKTRITLQGDVPSPIDPPPGCRFASRCRYAVDSCREASPPLREVAPDHFCACHLV